MCGERGFFSTYVYPLGEVVNCAVWALGVLAVVMAFGGDFGESDPHCPQR
jgi:hypothetical protein